MAIDFWIHPITGLVTAAEFTTTFEGDATDWELELARLRRRSSTSNRRKSMTDASTSRPLPAAGGRPSPRAILAVVGFGVFVAADDLTVVSTMLRPIIGDLGLVLPDGLDDAAWIVNAYLIAFVAVMPIAGRISDVIGRRMHVRRCLPAVPAGSILIPLDVDRWGGSCSAAS